MKLFIFLLVFSGLSALAHEIDWNKYNSSVAIYLERTDGSSDVCSGVLIHPAVVLTAAHCTLGIKSASVAAEFKSPVKEWIHSPHYRGNTLDHNVDVGLMFLTYPTVHRVNFPTLGAFKEEDTLERIGFGARNGYNTRNWIEMKYLEKKDNLLEAQDAFGFPGDSGGPVFQSSEHEFRLIGLHTGRKLLPNGELADISFVQLIWDDEILTWIHQEMLARVSIP